MVQNPHWVNNVVTLTGSLTSDSLSMKYLVESPCRGDGVACDHHVTMSIVTYVAVGLQKHTHKSAMPSQYVTRTHSLSYGCKTITCWTLSCKVHLHLHRRTRKASFHEANVRNVHLCHGWVETTHCCRGKHLSVTSQRCIQAENNCAQPMQWWATA